MYTNLSKIDLYRRFPFFLVFRLNNAFNFCPAYHWPSSLFRPEADIVLAVVPFGGASMVSRQHFTLLEAIILPHLGSASSGCHDDRCHRFADWTSEMKKSSGPAVRRVWLEFH